MKKEDFIKKQEDVLNTFEAKVTKEMQALLNSIIKEHAENCLQNAACTGQACEKLWIKWKEFGDLSQREEDTLLREVSNLGWTIGQSDSGDYLILS